MGWVNSLLRVGTFVVLIVAGGVGAWFIFVEYPDSTHELAGVVLLLLVVPIVFKLAANIAQSTAPAYNVAEVGVTGPITRETSASPLGAAPIGANANAIVEQIERANADTSVDALLVRLNTPGGEIVPSEDIKLAVERFEGPTIGYATDTCASGGYEIASGCDELWARNGSIVGSIGVIGSRVNAAELADRLGLSYEQLTAGEFKDAGMPLKEFEDHERAYLQGIVDEYYDQFVENVAERRDLSVEQIKETEARIYLGSRAHELGLVDELGTRKDVEARFEELTGKPAVVRRFEPQFGLVRQIGTGAQQVAYAFGAGLTSTFGDGERFRLK